MRLESHRKARMGIDDFHGSYGSISACAERLTSGRPAAVRTFHRTTIAAAPAYCPRSAILCSLLYSAAERSCCPTHLVHAMIMA